MIILVALACIATGIYLLSDLRMTWLRLVWIFAIMSLGWLLSLQAQAGGGGDQCGGGPGFIDCSGVENWQDRVDCEQENDRIQDEWNERCLGDLDQQQAQQWSPPQMALPPNSPTMPAPGIMVVESGDSGFSQLWAALGALAAVGGFLLAWRRRH